MKLVRRKVADLGIGSEVDMAGSVEAKVMMGYEPMTFGYADAVERLANAATGGGEASNQVYAFLFEACNWLVSIGNRAGDVFPLNPTARGIRFARNAAHHNWASAVEPPQDRDSWVWRRNRAPCHRRS